MRKKDNLDLIYKKEYVSEPVNDAIDRILSSKEKRIILAGDEGTGKSVTLAALQKRGKDTNEQTIYMAPDRIINFGQEPCKNCELYDAKMFDYLYELEFASSLLSYIKTNYYEIFKAYFEDMYNSIEADIKLLYKQANDISFSMDNKPILDIKYTTNEICPDIINKFRNLTEIEKLNLAINGFDKANGSSKYVQNLFAQRFDLFDKVVLETTDISDKEERLTNEGYDIQKLTYSSNKEILREIIKRRIQAHCKLANRNWDERLFTEDNKSFAIEKVMEATTDIDLCLDIVFETFRSLDFGLFGRNFEEVLKYTIIKQRENVREYKRGWAKPELYL